MQISGISAVGAGSLPAAPAAGGTAGASSSGAASGGASLTGTFLEGTVPAGPEMLTDAVQDAPFDQLFLTLIVLALLEGADRDEKGSPAAALLGFFVGLSLAAQLGEAISGGQMQAPGEIAGGGTGGQLDVRA